jgi:hypothetical protein
MNLGNVLNYEGHTQNDRNYLVCSLCELTRMNEIIETERIVGGKRWREEWGVIA